MNKYKAFVVNKDKHICGATLQEDLNKFFEECESAFVEVHNIWTGGAEPVTLFLAQPCNNPGYPEE